MIFFNIYNTTSSCHCSLAFSTPYPPKLVARNMLTSHILIHLQKFSAAKIQAYNGYNWADHRFIWKCPSILSFVALNTHVNSVECFLHGTFTYYFQFNKIKKKFMLIHNKEHFTKLQNKKYRTILMMSLSFPIHITATLQGNKSSREETRAQFIYLREQNNSNTG